MAGSRGLQWVVCGGHAITSGGRPDVYATLPLRLSSGIGDQTPVLPCPLLRSWRDCGMAGGVMGLGIAQPPDASRTTGASRASRQDVRGPAGLEAGQYVSRSLCIRRLLVRSIPRTDAVP